METGIILPFFSNGKIIFVLEGLGITKSRNGTLDWDWGQEIG